MKQDWAAVAATIEEHLARVGLDQRGLAERAGVALSIVRELRRNTVQRRRNVRTLEALSVALGLDSRHLSAVAAGHPPPTLDVLTAATAADIYRQLATISERLNELVLRMDVLDAKITTPSRPAGTPPNAL